MSLGAIWKAKEEGDLKGSGSLNKKELIEAIKAMPEGEETLRIALFVNSFKKSSKHPDLNIVLSKSQGAAAPKQSTKTDSIF